MIFSILAYHTTTDNSSSDCYYLLVSTTQLNAETLLIFLSFWSELLHAALPNHDTANRTLFIYNRWIRRFYPKLKNQGKKTYGMLTYVVSIKDCAFVLMNFNVYFHSVILGVGFL